MPLDKKQPYRLYKAAFHPPLYEQPPDSGRFFYPDGVEVPLEKAVKMLCYLRHIVEKYGERFGVKWRPELIMHGVETLPSDQRHEQEYFYRYKFTGKPSEKPPERWTDIDEYAETFEDAILQRGVTER